MAPITFDHATRTYPGASKPAVDALDLDIADGEFLVLVGPSGCGKSTSLRMLAGLEEVTGGSIRIGDRDVTHIPPKDRDIAMVFQNYALYPHMSVADNMGFALKIAGMDKREIRTRVEEAAKILDLTDYLDRKPKALSGGQRQRVAMGRAIVRQPQCFLMDEPLSNLDAKLRVQTRTQIASLQRRLGTTTVYVTHDQVEAMTMGDRVALLKDGLLQQVDTPRHLYDRPANNFDAGFIGSPAMNLVDVDLTEDGARIGDHTVPIPRDARTELGNQGARGATLGFRPESVEVVGEGEGFPFEVLVVEELGSDAYAYGSLHLGPDSNGSDDRMFIARVDARRPPSKGETVHLRIREAEEHVFNPDTGLRVGGAASAH
ncbi:MAG: multiple sugar transport system ATP-binding protein [Pseudonocardiales bacterium]|nr:multiple sugar transport system ATP-binding protein [Pseudonocardiales bacterium]